MSPWPDNLAFEAVKSNWASVVDSPVAVTDNQSSKYAAVLVSGFSKGILIAHASNNTPIAWTRQKKCADGAVVEKSGGKIIAHIFEHKSKLTPEEWFKAKGQFEGMCLNVKAVLGVVGSDQPHGFVLYLSYTEEAMNNKSDPADMVLRKALTGSTRPILDVTDWKVGEVDVPAIGTFKVVKVARDPTSGEASVAI
jgi:hypothetical protein